MEEAKINRIESVTKSEDGNLRVVVIMDKQEFAKKFIPYYEIQSDLRKELLPHLLEEALKQKDDIVKQVLKEVNWSEVVRSEVAQRVIQEIAKGRGY